VRHLLVAVPARPVHEEAVYVGAIYRRRLAAILFLQLLTEHNLTNSAGHYVISAIIIFEIIYCVVAIVYGTTVWFSTLPYCGE